MMLLLLVLICGCLVASAQECFPATPVYGTDADAWLVSDMPYL